MATSITFDTGYIKFEDNSNTGIKFTGSIKRTGKTLITVTVKATSQYAICVDNITFYLGVNDSYKKFTGNSSTGASTNGYSQVSSKKVPMHFGCDSYGNIINPNQGGTVTVWDNVEFQLSDNGITSDDEIYTSIWFHCPGFYHIDTGIVASATGGISLSGADVLDVLYKAPSGYSLECDKVDDVGTNSLKIKHSWTSGTDSLTTNKIVVKDSDTVINTYTGLGNGSTVTLENNIVSNTYYEIVGTISDGTTTKTSTINRWTKPKITSDGLTLSLKSGEEHDVIIAKAKASTASSYDQFRFKINDGEWSAWTSRASSATRNFSGLSGGTKYTISFQMRNPHVENGGYDTTYYAGGIDNPTTISKSITTWYNPVSNLKLNLVKNWYWYLQIKASYSYYGTISKYEFIIGDETYKTVTGNSYSRGSTVSNTNGNLDYNTNYLCKVRLTDNHGRVYETNSTFKTLDERPLYLNGELKEVKLIKSNNTVETITPNLLTVIDSNGNAINMNKIINNDNRTEFE